MLSAGEVADGLGSAYVEGLQGAQGRTLLGAGGDGGFEVEGVGDVELGGDGHGAGEGDELVVDGDVSFVPRGFGEAFDLGGHVPADGFVDQPVELGGLDLVCDRRDLPVHEPRRLGGEAGGLAGDQPGFPGDQVTGDQAVPEAGEAVAELEALAEVTVCQPRSTARARQRTRGPRTPPLLAHPHRPGRGRSARIPEARGLRVRGSSRPDASPPSRWRADTGRPRPGPQSGGGRGQQPGHPRPCPAES